MISHINNIGKRAMDLAGALVGLFLFSPIIALFAILIHFDSPGKFFYVHQRVGLNGKKFKLIKLRTMYLDGEQRLANLFESNDAAKEAYTNNHCLNNDPRVAGHWALLARQYSIDELPQFINVLIGNMSLVGPRPLSEVDMIRFIPPESRSRKLSVKPGMTGLWQVSRKGKHEVAQNMAQFDLKYIEDFSLLTDIFILLKTVRAVLSGRGQV